MITTLINGNADPQLLDSFGYSSLDWASVYEPLFIAMGSHAESYVPTPKDVREVKLRAKAAKSIQDILTTEASNRSFYLYDLGRCLLFLQMFSKFYVVVMQLLRPLPISPSKRTKRGGDFAEFKFEVTCSACNYDIQSNFYVCKVCYDSDYCEPCFQSKQKKGDTNRPVRLNSVWKCKGHEFARIPIEVEKASGRRSEGEAGTAGLEGEAATRRLGGEEAGTPLYNKNPSVTKAMRNEGGAETDYIHLVEEVACPSDMYTEEGQDFNVDTWLENLYKEFSEGIII
jgi:hypothetical protein